MEPEEKLSEIAEYIPRHVFNPILVNTSRIVNAFARLIFIYEGWGAKRRIAVVSIQEESQDAVNGHSKVIFVIPPFVK